jgi:lysophospholipase L1-like esterase
MTLRRAALIVAASASVIIVAGCSSLSPEPSPSPSTAPEPIRIAVVGDSNTTGLQGSLENGVANGTAWVAQLTSGEFKFVGGWARDGATSTVMAQQTQPIADVDLLVIMAGTNNAAQGISTEQLAADFETIAATIDADEVVLSADPPLDGTPEVIADLNVTIAEIAKDEGWRFHDSWAELRSPQQKWLPEYRLDGVHTTKEGYGVMASDMESYLLAVVERRYPEPE